MLLQIVRNGAKEGRGASWRTQALFSTVFLFSVDQQTWEILVLSDAKPQVLDLHGVTANFSQYCIALWLFPSFIATDKPSFSFFLFPLFLVKRHSCHLFVKIMILNCKVCLQKSSLKCFLLDLVFSWKTKILYNRETSLESKVYSLMYYFKITHVTWYSSLFPYLQLRTSLHLLGLKNKKGWFTAGGFSCKAQSWS